MTSRVRANSLESAIAPGTRSVVVGSKLTVCAYQRATGGASH